jgi:hypothetical protein
VIERSRDFATIDPPGEITMTKTLARAYALALSFAAGSAAMAQNSITLFGQQYSVERITYSDQISFPGVTFPADTVRIFEAEGAAYIGNNKLLISADDTADVFIGEPDNWIVEVDVITAPNGTVSLQGARRVVTVDSGSYDPNPGGVTINTSATGLGANGNLVVGGNDGFLFAYRFSGVGAGQLLETNSANLCPVQAGGCFVSIEATNFNLEDITFVPGNDTRVPQFLTINQDLGGLDIAGVERRSTSGALLGSFPVGGTVQPGLAGGVAKGLAYSPDSPALPATIRRPDGVVLVSFDRDFPALQAFDISGNLLGTEYLTTNNLPTGPSRLDNSGCSLRVHLESLAIDPTTGRLFLISQGNFLSCNYMWVLTPVAPCLADIAGPGPSVGADGELTADDIILFISRFTAGC